jgi:nitrite reductase/ring-hydroxylating ferredoxin subunit
MAFQRAAPVDEVPPGQTKFVKLGETPVILANRDGQIHALYGICPHQHYPLEGAILWGHLLECPWHHFQFDVRSGENHYPRNVYPASMTHLQSQVQALKKYHVAVRGWFVWVDVNCEGSDAKANLVTNKLA